MPSSQDEGILFWPLAQSSHLPPRASATTRELYPALLFQSGQHLFEQLGAC